LGKRIINIVSFTNETNKIIRRIIRRQRKGKKVKEMMLFVKIPIPLGEIGDALGHVLDKIKLIQSEYEH
jgi:HAMP domain-containing protein